MSRFRIQGTALRQVGRSVQIAPGAEVLVRNEAGEVVDYFETQTSDPQPSPLIVGADGAYDFYVDDTDANYFDIIITTRNGSVDNRVYVTSGAESNLEATISARDDAVKSAADALASAINAEISEINASIAAQTAVDAIDGIAPATPVGEIDPTTLTSFSGQNKAYQGYAYYWNGAAYVLATSAAQIVQNIGLLVSGAGDIPYIRTSTTSYAVFVPTVDNGGAGATAPAKPVFTLARGLKSVDGTITPTSDGGSPLTGRFFSYRPSGSTSTIREAIDETTTAFSINADDGELIRGQIIDVNAIGESPPSDFVEARAFDIAGQATFTEDDVVPVAGGFSVFVRNADAGGLAITSNIYTITEV